MKVNANSNPLISIITVTFNAQKDLEETIQSVINQSYAKVEYLVIDGASADGTVDIIKNYEEKLAYWVSEPDGGVYDAMNKGLYKATGEWIYFLGAGDVLYNELDKIIPMLNDNHTIYYGDVYREDIGSVYAGKFSAFKFSVLNICHQAIFYPAIVFKKYRYNTKYKMQADHALNMQCYGDNRFQFKYLPVTVCKYQGNGISATKLDFPFFADKLKLIKANFSFIVYVYAATRRAIASVLKPVYKQH